MIAGRHNTGPRRPGRARAGLRLSFARERVHGRRPRPPAPHRAGPVRRAARPPLPYGASARREGVNFSVFSRHATEMSLVLFFPGEPSPCSSCRSTRATTGPATSGTCSCAASTRDRVRLPGRQRGPRRARPRCASTRGEILIDPFSKSVAGLERWGDGGGSEGPPRAACAPGSSTRSSTGATSTRSRCRSPTRSSTSCTCAASPATPSSGVAHPGHLPRPGREDPVPAGAGRHRGRADAGDRVRGVRQPAQQPADRRAAAQLLGLPAGLVLRAQGRLRVRAGPGGRGARVQGDGEGAPRGRHRGDPRRRLQPHRRGRRARRHLLLPRPRQPDLLHARAEDGRSTSTTPAAATRSTATTRSCAT